jgi:hypothetical protein
MINKKFTGFLMPVFLMACTQSGHDIHAVALTDLVGLWNSSETQGSQQDIIYTRISSSGDIIEYDYDGDDVDQGLNCYQVDTGSIQWQEANRFLITADMHSIKQFIVELELLDNGHALKIYFLDNDDPTKTLNSQIWTREADVSILDKEPSCTNRKGNVSYSI